MFSMSESHIHFLFWSGEVVKGQAQCAVLGRLFSCFLALFTECIGMVDIFYLENYKKKLLIRYINVF